MTRGFSRPRHLKPQPPLRVGLRVLHPSSRVLCLFSSPQRTQTTPLSPLHPTVTYLWFVLDCSPLSTLSPDLLRIWICCSKFTNEILYFNTKETQQDLMTATTFYHNLSSLLHGLRDLLSTPIPTTCDHDDVTLSVPSTTSSCCGRPPVEKVLSLSKSCLLSLTCLEKYILTEIHKTNTKIRTAYKTADLGALIYTLNGFMEMLKSLLPVLIVQMKSKEYVSPSTAIHPSFLMCLFFRPRRKLLSSC